MLGLDAIAPQGAAGAQALSTGLERAHGVVDLRFDRLGEATVMTRAYQEAALRVRQPRPEPGAPVEAVILTMAGGLTGGDRLTIGVAAGERARAVVTTVAAEKIYRSIDGSAKIRARMAVESGADFAYLPQETILFEGAALDRRLDVDIAADARFTAVESVVFGRLAHGETIRAGSLRDIWRVRRGGRLIYADGLGIDGAMAERLNQRAAGSGARASATLLRVAPDAEALLDGVRDLIERHGSVEAGASAFDGLLTIRLVAREPQALRRAVTALLEHIWAPLPRVWSI